MRDYSKRIEGININILRKVYTTKSINLLTLIIRTKNRSLKKLQVFFNQTLIKSFGKNKDNLEYMNI
jgi:hypothetical protein